MQYNGQSSVVSVFFFARSTSENLGLFVGLCYMKRGYVHVILICSHLTSVLVYSFLRLARWFLDSFPIFNALRSVEEIFCHPKCFTGAIRLPFILVLHYVSSKLCMCKKFQPKQRFVFCVSRLGHVMDFFCLHIFSRDSCLLNYC